MHMHVGEIMNRTGTTLDISPVPHKEFEQAYLRVISVWHHIGVDYVQSG